MTPSTDTSQPRAVFISIAALLQTFTLQSGNILHQLRTKQWTDEHMKRDECGARQNMSPKLGCNHGVRSLFNLSPQEMCSFRPIGRFHNPPCLSVIGPLRILAKNITHMMGYRRNEP